jgi:hypothetical protein
MMNTVDVDTGERSLEDFVAIPDLATGMLAEIVSRSDGEQSDRQGFSRHEALSGKSDRIADWFWHQWGSLKKTALLIDRAGEGTFGIGELRAGYY